MYEKIIVLCVCYYHLLSTLIAYNCFGFNQYQISTISLTSSNVSTSEENTASPLTKQSIFSRLWSTHFAENKSFIVIVERPTKRSVSGNNRYTTKRQKAKCKIYDAVYDIVFKNLFVCLFVCCLFVCLFVCLRMHTAFKIHFCRRLVHITSFHG